MHLIIQLTQSLAVSCLLLAVAVECQSSRTDICELKPDIGPCEAIFPKYFFNASSGNCERFNYGGCRGNDNRFDSLADCQATCKKDKCPTICPAIHDPVCGSDGVTYTSRCRLASHNCLTNSDVKVVSLGECEDLCSLPVQPGPCKASFQRFYFDAKLGVCRPFIYGGCRGNANRFNTSEECSRACPKISRDPCRGFSCQNGGSCTAPADAPYCICQPGFHGDRCQLKGDPVSHDVRDLCASVLRCSPGTECRPVAACDTCAPVAHCTDIGREQPDLDSVCRASRYLTTLLVHDPATGVYSTKKCPVGVFKNETCPLGSVCVSDGSSIGVCCTGKPEVKPGTCPAEEGPFSICGGVPCDYDSDCSGDAKCCVSGCGGNMCKDVDLGCGRCPNGFRCVQRPVDCPPGRFCILALVPTCVPDACADCRADQECRNVTNTEPCVRGQECQSRRYFCAVKSRYSCGPDLPCPTGQTCQSAILCSTPTRPHRVRRQAETGGFDDILDPFCARETSCRDAPQPKKGFCPRAGPVGVCGGVICQDDTGCPGDHKCCDSACGGKLCTPAVSEVVTTPRPVDLCGGCPNGQKCVDTTLRCVRAPCPTWQCQPDCGGRCGPDQECRLLSAPCSAPRCDPVPVCVSPPCGAPCPRGQRCEVTETCSVFGYCRDRETCLPSGSAPCPEDCPKGKGHTCQWEIKPCSNFRCLFRGPEFQPRCVKPPDTPRAGVCPPAPERSARCLYRRWFMSSECDKDDQCQPGHKCCRGDCGFDQCVRVE